MLNQSKQELKNSGLFIGIVKDNMDPERLGRLKVLVPNYNDNAALDDIQWFNYVSCYGGYKDEGFFFIPTVGAEVVVMFIGGGETPVWLGCINKTVDNPGPRESTQEADDEHYYHRKQIKTRIGWVMFDDKDETISIVHNTGSFITFTKDGDIDIRAFRNINLKAGKNMTATAENGSFCLEASDSAKMETHEGDLNLSADKGKILIDTLNDNLNIASAKDVVIVSKEKTNINATKDMTLTSTEESVYTRAKKNTETYAEEQIKAHSEKESLYSAKSDLALSSSKDVYKYAEGSNLGTCGTGGKIIFSTSTDLVCTGGEFNIVSSNGDLKLSSKGDLILDSQKNCNIYAKQDVAVNADKTIKMLSRTNTEVLCQQSFNVNVLQNVNLTAAVDCVFSAATGMYLSSAQLLDIYAAFKIYEHTPMQLIHESGVIHNIKDNIEVNQSKGYTQKSNITSEITSGNHSIKAARISLN